MGLLDRIVHRVVNTVVDAAVDNVMDSVLGRKEPAAADGTVKTLSTEQENREETKQENCSGERLLRQRIEEIAARELPEYELRQKVSFSEVNAPEGAREFFDYGFYRDGRLVAVIMILMNNNAYRYVAVRRAQRGCREQQVVYMNFMAYMMNRPEYISQRLKANLS